ncbi:hypothetical protein C4571_01710 [Candidatus Parcubacteria bacterium]|nr:MAG: hypothetical protein C4571_01710 [Candidatus Parcubacteria bacterium]
MREDIERRILKRLYRSYKEKQKVSKFPAVDIFREFSIANGSDLSSVHKSNFIDIDQQENFYITDKGINYMNRIYAEYEKLAGPLKNWEMINRDKESRAFAYVDKKTQEEKNITPPILNVFNLQSHSGNGDNIQGSKVVHPKQRNGRFPKKNQVLLTILITLATAGSAPWWWSPVINFVKEKLVIINTFPGDPSRTINGSVFDIVKKLNQLPTDIERQSLVRDYYSGLGTRTNPRLEYGKIVNTQPQDSISLVKIQGYDDSSLMLTCEFDSKWNQKLRLITNSDIAFWGKIKNYDVSRSSLILESCVLSQ